MEILAKEWALDGSLHAFSDAACTWDSLEWHGTSWINGTDPLPTESEIDGAVTVETIDGAPAYVFRRESGAPGWNSGSGVDRVRTEAGFSDWTCKLADWVDEEEAGADATEAYRWYRIAYRIGADFSTDYLAQSASSPFGLVWQLFHRLDTSPADTVGIPVLSGGPWLDGYGRLRHRIVQSRGSATLNTAANTTTEELASWTCPPDTWNDLVIQARWSHSSLGELRVWLNRRPIMPPRIGVANCYNNAPSRGGLAIRPKISGPYAGPWSLVQNLEFTTYHRGMIVGKGEYSLENFAAMHPEDSSAAPLARAVVMSGAVG